MTDTLTQLEEAARAGDPVDPVQFAAARVAGDIAALRRAGHAAEQQAGRERARLEEIDNILNDLRGATVQYEVDLDTENEALRRALRSLVELATARTKQIAAASSRLATLGAVAPGKQAAYWTGTLVDQRHGSTSHTFADAGSLVAQVLRSALPADTVTTIRNNVNI